MVTVLDMWVYMTVDINDIIVYVIIAICYIQFILLRRQLWEN